MEAFSELRSRLMERLDSMWESTDEEVMELIDSLIMEEGRMLGLNLGRKAHCGRNCSAPSGNWMSCRSYWRIPVLRRSW